MLPSLVNLVALESKFNTTYQLATVPQVKYLTHSGSIPHDLDHQLNTMASTNLIETSDIREVSQIYQVSAITGDSPSSLLVHVALTYLN
jgi:hypothetical protein